MCQYQAALGPAEASGFCGSPPCQRHSCDVCGSLQPDGLRLVVPDDRKKGGRQHCTTVNPLMHIALATRPCHRNAGIEAAVGHAWDTSIYIEGSREEHRRWLTGTPRE
ncbi:hypothetical protein MRX96_042912 [Rhipicephalus microplus]